MQGQWHRVSPQRPCKICRKPDWCGYTDNGLSCCMRVPSDHESLNGGWLHGAAQKAPVAPVARWVPDAYEAPAFDAGRWWETVRHVCRPPRLTPWADALSLPVSALDWMGGCTLGAILAFPMYDGEGHVCGIRTRTQAGEKRAVTGSRAGVFLPTVRLDGPPVVCEGPTDAAAAMALGYEPIGRPSCSGSERHVVDTCKRMGYERVTVCADNDGPGVTGARRLANVLNAARISVRMVIPGGYKDLRDWFRAGVTRETVDAAWSQSEWRS